MRRLMIFIGVLTGIGYLVSGICFAWQVSRQFSSGISLKTLYNQLYTYKSSNVMFDWGGLYKLKVKNQKLKIGLLMQNIPTKLKFTDELESVPFNLKAGMAWLPPWIRGLTLAMDVNMPIDAQPAIHTSVEYWIKNMLALRTGYKYQSAQSGLGGLSNLACGLGFRIRRYQLDYAFVPRGTLGNNTHMFSLGAKF